jgi:histidine triad (HIT) family protein
MSDGCVFCAIVAGTGEASVVLQDDRVTAFMDIRPVTPGHTLVVPNTHATYLADLDPEDGGWMFRAALRVAAALRASDLTCDGVNFYYADGEAAGQEVFHAHLHVFPRFAGDGWRIDSPAFRNPLPPRTVLDGHAQAVREALERA